MDILIFTTLVLTHSVREPFPFFFFFFSNVMDVEIELSSRNPDVHVLVL